MTGNCLTFALGMLLAEGFTGRIEPRLLAGWPPKVRFYYVDEVGQSLYFYPLHPKAGWRSCVHSLWFNGQVRKG